MTRHRLAPVWLRGLAAVTRGLASRLSFAILPLYPLEVAGEGLVPGRDILHVIAGHQPRLLLPGELLRDHRVSVRHLVQPLPVVPVLEAGLDLLQALLLLGLGKTSLRQCWAFSTSPPLRVNLEVTLTELDLYWLSQHGTLQRH